MGVLNVTPDSFSDGGRFDDPGRAVDHGLRMESEGAEILDVGGESTRPGAEAVSTEEELRRVLPVIRQLSGQSKALISIDTSKARVAAEALQAGAVIINDVTGLTGDPAMVEVAAQSRAGLVVMHMIGTPRTMQENPQYQDVTREVADFLRQRLEALAESGIDKERVVIDPGIGFGKTVPHNLELLRQLDQIAALHRPLLLGVSRKSFLGKITGLDSAADRLWPTVALTALARWKGVRLLRVHDAAENHQALRMTEAILHHV